MTQDRDINANLNLRPVGDKEVIAAIRAITKEMDALKREARFDQLAKGVANFAKRTGNTAQAVRVLAQELAKVGASEDEIKRVTQQFERLRQTTKDIRPPDMRPTGMGAGAAGGVDAGRLGSVAGFAGQAAGAAGLGGIGSQLGLLGSSLGALGPVGVAATAASVGLGVALTSLRKSEEEAAKAIERTLALNEDRVALDRQTSEELEKLRETRQASIEDLQKLVKAAEELAATAEAGEPRIEGAASNWGEFVNNLQTNLFEIGDAVGLVGSEADTAQAGLADLRDQLATAEGELANVEGALRSDEVAANDAAAALEDLARQMDEDLLDAASDAGEAIRFETQALSRSKEANEARLDAIDREKEAIEAELAVLKARGSTSEKVTQQIETLNEKLSDLGTEAQTVADIADTQVSEAFKKAGEEAQRAAETTRKEARRTAENAKKERERAREQAEKDRLKGLEDELKTLIDFANKRAEIEFDAQVERQQIAIDANREQKRMVREATQETNQDFEQDFLAAFQRQQELAFQLSERQIAGREAFQDVSTGVQNQLLQLGAQQEAQAVTTQNINTFNFPTSTRQEILQLMQQLGIT